METFFGVQMGSAAVLAAAAGAWFAYFRLKQNGPGAFRLMVLAIIGGHLSAVGAVLLYNRLEAWGFATDWRVLEGSWTAGLPLSLVVGFVEEGTKLVPVLLIALWTRPALRSRDTIILAACAGLGFSAAENVMISHQGLSNVESLARALTTPVTHALFAAPWGLGLASLLLRGRPLALGVRFAVSVSAHAAYDLLLAHPQIPLAASAAIVLGLWVWMLARVSPATVRRIHERTTGLRPALAFDPARYRPTSPSLSALR